MFSLIVPITIARKKSVEPFAFIGIFEVFDYLTFPITTSKAHAIGGSVVALLWECLVEIVEVSKIPVLSYFAFSYFMMCILNYALCFIGICFRYYSVSFRLQNYDIFLI